MKSVRLLVLVLLAVLLPLRGAVAEVLLCAGHPGHSGPAAHAVADAASAHADHAQPVAADCEPAAVQVAADDVPQQHPAPAKCDTCTASCSMSPLVGDTPAIASPAPQPDRHASHHEAPVPSHLTDGPERPPRSI